MNSLLKKIWIIGAAFIILAAVCCSIFRSLTPWANQYKNEAAHYLSTLIGQPVTIKAMETGWYWLQPVIKLEDITISNQQKPPIHLEKLLVGINLFKSLLHWRIQPGILYIDDIHLKFRKKKNHWQIEGISLSAYKNELPADKVKYVINWLSQQERLIIKHASAEFYFNDGSLIPVNDINISIANNSGNYKLKGTAKLNQVNNTTFQILGNLYFNPYAFNQTQGQIYFAVNHVTPSQWHNLFPAVVEHLKGGKGDVALWLDLNEGVVTKAQALLNIKNVSWRLLNKQQSQLIQFFNGNLAWQLTKNGWLFNADKINLRVGGVTWPENQVSLKYDKEKQSYHLFAKSIIVESLLSQAIIWPKFIKNLLPLKPHGILSNTQITIKDKQINYILGRFEHLGWSKRGSIPQVENFSGALNWQPEEGHLELDSKNASIGIKNYPTQHLSLLNGIFDWKPLSDGLRFSTEHFILSQPDLTLSAQGSVDQLTQNSMGNIQLQMEFAGKNLQNWLTYLPKNYLKPRLFLWLTTDVKRLAEVSGKINISGMAKDFPFDNNNGEFAINSHIAGADLFITSKWPLIKDLEGDIQFRQRDFNANITRGNFQGVPLTQMNLVINDIGKDKETLLIHGIIEGQAQKMMNFVMNSPLKEKLAKLQMLIIKGIVLLNLRLEIPLYPENEENLLKGMITFKDNTFLVKHQVGALPIEKVSGVLTFDEQGMTQSILQGKAFDHPMTIKIESNKGAHPETLLTLEGQCTVDWLKKQFNSPLLSVLKGAFPLHAVLKITDEPNDFDTLTLMSSLQGLAVNLPAPLGKTYLAFAPLKLSLDFIDQKHLRLKSNYNNRLSTNILFKDHQGNLTLGPGQIVLGRGLAQDQNKAGLSIVGTLDGFDLQSWKNLLLQSTTTQTNFAFIKKIRIIDITLSQLTVLHQKLDNLLIKAKILSNNSWSFNLEQKKISADLIYQPATNSLSGLVKHLNLDKIDMKKNGQATANISPEKIPNLNLQIDNLTIGDLKIGAVSLKSQSTKNRFLINDCKIDSPIYRILINGEWTQEGKNDNTKIQLKLGLKDLAKNLAIWNITPAVDASWGEMEFNGGWNESLFHFSLAKINGVMDLQFKNGRITHLSPEAEEKLGLGKLLSILSLQTIPRRLKLDFSDLSQQGYSFDIFKGHFTINKGIMNTQDSYIDGPVAYAEMKGNLDLVKNLYDINLKISPHITASLPIVATIAGGPIAGLAAWVANKIINQSMQKIVAYSYKISGPWDKPVVEQLSIVKKAS